jgi:hypothetical protein
MEEEDATGGPADSPTGELRVDEALRALDALAELPTAEHPAVFERVHVQLAEVLGELGAGADQPGGQSAGYRPRQN